MRARMTPLPMECASVLTHREVRRSLRESVKHDRETFRKPGSHETEPLDNENNQLSQKDLQTSNPARN